MAALQLHSGMRLTAEPDCADHIAVTDAGAGLLKRASQFFLPQVMKNATLPPSKRSRIEHQMDKMILLMFALLFAMCLVGATLFALWTKKLSPAMWYIAPENAPTAFNPNKAVLSGVYSFVTSFVLYGYLIPISLYVSLEMVKVVQVRLLNWTIFSNCPLVCPACPPHQWLCRARRRDNFCNSRPVLPCHATLMLSCMKAQLLLL